MVSSASDRLVVLSDGTLGVGVATCDADMISTKSGFRKLLNSSTIVRECLDSLGLCIVCLGSTVWCDVTASYVVRGVVLGCGDCEGNFSLVLYMQVTKDVAHHSCSHDRVHDTAAHSCGTRHSH
jgi:hypothetical protein